MQRARSARKIVAPLSTPISTTFCPTKSREICSQYCGGISLVNNAASDKLVEHEVFTGQYEKLAGQIPEYLRELLGEIREHVQKLAHSKSRPASDAGPEMLA